jgi:hypothetical protein
MRVTATVQSYLAIILQAGSDEEDIQRLYLCFMAIRLNETNT